MVGLREWKMENTIWSNACQNDTSGVSCLAQNPNANPYTNVQDTIRENSDSHGIGLTIGLKGHYKFNNRISAASWARFGMLRGTATLGNQDENWFGTRTTTRCDTTGSYCTDFSYSTRRTFQQMDFGAKLLINIWSGLDGYAGYTFNTYQDGVTSVDYTSNGGAGLGTAIRTRNVGYDGFLLGLSWKF